jgi:hypothetical protein
VGQVSACHLLTFASATKNRTEQAEQTAEKAPYSFSHSQRREESLLGLNPRKESEIPRCARNDRILGFSPAFSPVCSACLLLTFASAAKIKTKQTEECSTFPS